VHRDESQEVRSHCVSGLDSGHSREPAGRREHLDRRQAGEDHRGGAHPIAAGADGRTRVLFSSPDGHGVLLLLDTDNTLNAKHDSQP
jgi:hypothetical protein